MNLEHAEDVKIAPVGGGDALDSGTEVVDDQQGIEITLAAQPVASRPVQKQREGMGAGFNNRAWVSAPLALRLSPVQCFQRRRVLVDAKVIERLRSGIGYMD
ncbi:MAG: hypothetical protein Tsb0027_23800 [Wenzhouxiangellaceae bacterium]